MCFSMLQKPLWRKGNICSTCPEPACLRCARHSAKGEETHPQPGRDHGCSHKPFGQLQFPPSSPMLCILEGYINTRLSALLDGGLLAWIAAEALPHGLSGQGVHVNMGLPSLTCPSNLSCSSARGWSQDLSLSRTPLPMVPLWTPPALLTWCGRTYLWLSAPLVNVTHDDRKT